MVTELALVLSLSLYEHIAGRSITVACGVVRYSTICLKLKLDMRLKRAEFWQCKISSLKSASITQGTAHRVTCVNSLVNKVISVARGTLGDLYTTAM